MKCPTCITTDLLMSERAGIEIDYCPQCRGIWLDRGELDKILARSAEASPPPDPSAVRQNQHGNTHQFGNGGYQMDRHHHESHYQKVKKPFWQELFD